MLVAENTPKVAEKRRLFKFLGLGVLSSVIAGKSAAAVPNDVMPQYIWLHGHDLEIEFPDRVERTESTAQAKIIYGQSYSRNLFHFTPDIQYKASACHLVQITVRYKSLPGAMINAIHIHDGESLISSTIDMQLSSGEWIDVQLNIHSKPKIKRALCISIEVGFAAVARKIEINSIGLQLLV